MNKIISNNALFASEIDYIEYQSPQNAVYADFSIKKNNYIVYQNRYHLHISKSGADNFAAYSIDNIINDYLERTSRTIDKLHFSIRFYDDYNNEIDDYWHNQDGSCLVIYTRSIIKNITANEMLFRFISVNIPRFIASDGIAYLSYYLPAPMGVSVNQEHSESVYYRVTYQRYDNTTSTVTTVFQRRVTYNVVQEKVDMALLRSQINTITNNNAAKILSFTVEIGTRRAQFYVDHRTTLRTFYFKNAFNVWDMLLIPTKTTRKLKTDSSTASIRNRLHVYDIEHTQSFEESSGNLLAKSSIWIEQFLTSIDIRLAEDPTADINDCPRIVIDDYTCELSNAPGQTASIKFEWRYNDKRMQINFLVDKENRLRIFTDEFTEEYI